MKFAARLRSLAAIAVALAGTNVMRAAKTAPISPISFETALADAQALAALHPHMTVMRIAGVSMLPYFGSGSLVVVKKISPAHLREGMVVVYRNHFGEIVAHRLVARVEGGWQVRGWNNDRADSTIVNGANLLGVVYATFQSDGVLHDGPKALFASTVSGLQVALAAPAK